MNNIFKTKIGKFIFDIKSKSQPTELDGDGLRKSNIEYLNINNLYICDIEEFGTENEDPYDERRFGDDFSYKYPVQAYIDDKHILIVKDDGYYIHLFMFVEENKKYSCNFQSKDLKKIFNNAEKEHENIEFNSIISRFNINQIKLIWFIGNDNDTKFINNWKKEKFQ